MADPMTWVEAPARQARPNRSLDVIPVHDVSNDHFVGFQYQADPCVMPSSTPQDCYVQVGPAQGSSKTFGEMSADVTTEVFGLYAGIECYLNGGLGEFRAAAGRMLAAGEHYGVDVQLAVVLAADDAVLTPAGAGVARQFAALEGQLGQEVPAQGYIYASPALLTLAAEAGLLVRNLDGTLETYLGTKVVVLTSLGAGTTAYATGPINIWRGAATELDAPDVTHNKGRALAERLYSIAIECGVWSAALS